jgi:hypothetical protein
MDRSRITAPGVVVTFVSSPAALAGTDADLIIVDVGRPGVLAALAALAALAVPAAPGAPDREAVPVIGFASHVDRDLMAAARSAGCPQVLARSAFFRRVPELLAGGPGGAGAESR